ncbi:LOW QUALITY PROTEIN: hypothetical protein HID58_001445 [Brassica napus]|uniref:Uncharacterized protein n=1 Tax=Brassica napus TaxID=3708 RepID=A0ABQ8EK03_BRANA|nr:LOW QUALITY PROTEIN: hypothetical protein HID58_001445 [Brassica napus]
MGMGKHGRGSAASTKALEDGQFGTSNQPIRGTVNYHTSNQTGQIAVDSSKDRTASSTGGWNDGWYMTPETQPSAATAEEMEASAPRTMAVGKDQGMSIQGKQHASRSNYGDSKKTNTRDSSKAHMQQSGHGLGQQDLHVASNEIRGQSGGRQYSRDRTYASQKRDVAGYEQQGFTPDQKMTSADTPDHSQNRSASREVRGGHNPNSMFQKNAGQNRRFGRGQESHGGWGSSSMQENMHHHHQRPLSNRDRQKPNLHYEYKPVGSHAYDGEQLKDSSEGPRYREKGQGNQRHGGQKSYQQQGVVVLGRNTGHGLSDEMRETKTVLVWESSYLT